MLRRIATLFLISLSLAAGPAAPPPPDSYHAFLRYDIYAYGSERIVRFRDMVKALDDAGFVRDPEEVIAGDEPDNPRATRMSGILPSKSVEEVLKQRAIRTMLLLPKGAKLPDKGGRVRVELQLSSGFHPTLQRDLAWQTAAVLTKDVGFVEAVGYDRREDSRLIGSVPADGLDKLVEDVRKLPAATGRLRNVSPVRLIVARPDWPLPSGPVPIPPVPRGQTKFTPDLRAVLARPDAAKPARLEVILGWTPEKGDKTWQRLVEQSGGVAEGRIGALITVWGVPAEVAPKLEAMHEIAHVRLPRRGSSSGEAPPNWEPVRDCGPVKLHAVGKRGLANRVAIVADDFAGWQNIRASKGQVTFVDLTAERNLDLKPDPFPTKAGDGYGTRCARSLLQAMPESEFTLVRIDGSSPYMLQTVAEAIDGDAVRSVSLDRRLNDLRRERVQLDRDAVALNEERQRVLADPSADDEGLRKQQEYRKKHDAFEAEEKTYEERRARYFDLFRDLRRLKGVKLVASALTWPEGHPTESTSTMSRYFDERPFRSALWFQPAGVADRQAWSGLFRDEDGNGVMEFVPGDKRLPNGIWSRELNFLAWQPAKGAAERTIPAATRFRVSLQWREAHDPLPLREGDDVYREPLSKFEVVVVRQADPDGKTRPADDFDVVATTVGTPSRLDQTLNAATYEAVVDLTVGKPGRYAVFVKGVLPNGLQAPGETTLPTARKRTEVRPRLSVRTLAGPGSAVWATFP